MLEMAPDPKEMIGGGMSASAAAMEYLLQQTSSQNKQARKVLGWLRTGMKFEFVCTDHASQEKAPHRKRTLEVVRKKLQSSGEGQSGGIPVQPNSFEGAVSKP